MIFVNSDNRSAQLEQLKTDAPLPEAVVGEFRNLSEAGKNAVRKLSGARPFNFIKELCLAWVTIIIMIVIAHFWQNIWFTMFAIFIIATRQNILGLLIHEQVHHMFRRGRLGDALANLFAGWPLLSLSVEGYAKVHIAHHKFYSTDRDPDFVRKQGKSWTFPMKWGQLCWLFFTDLVGINILKTVKGKNTKIAGINRVTPLPVWVRMAYYLFFALLFTYFELWTIFLIYWLVPLLTVLQVIIRFAAICEHKYSVAQPTLQNTTAIINLSWWEKIILPNLNFTSYHIYHHYLPGISCQNLPKVHQVFETEGLVDKTAEFNGYFSYIKYLMSPQVSR